MYIEDTRKRKGASGRGGKEKKRDCKIMYKYIEYTEKERVKEKGRDRGIKRERTNTT